MSDPVALAEARAAAGEITRQRLHQIRRANGVPAPRIGSPPLRARELKPNARGNVVVQIQLPANAVEQLTELAAKRRMRGRDALASMLAEQGITKMLGRPPAKHALPSGQSAMMEGRVKVEMAPGLLSVVDMYAEEHGAKRNVVLVTAILRALSGAGS